MIVYVSIPNIGRHFSYASGRFVYVCVFVHLCVYVYVPCLYALLTWFIGIIISFGPHRKDETAT